MTENSIITSLTPGTTTGATPTPVPSTPDSCATIASGAELPTLLSESCLYSTTPASTTTFNSYILPYNPNYPLWSDGATKVRYIYIPPGTQINTADMENWNFPVGTRLWKEFSVNGKRFETRLFVKVSLGTGLASWKYGSYAWAVDQKEATLSPAGVINALGTGHDIPSTGQCIQCHTGAKDAVLGFDALQLSQVSDPSKNYITLAGLVYAKQLTVKPAAPYQFTIPGTAVDQAALGYLHANCASCHSPLGTAAVMGMNFKHNLSAISMFESNAYISSITTGKVLPGQPTQSREYIRMTARPGGMPAIGSNAVDTVGAGAVSAWITELSPPFLFSGKALVRGSYVSSTGLMNDNFRAAATLPTSEPFSALTRFKFHTRHESFSSGLLARTGNSALSDWVLIELRSSSASSKVVASRAGLLLRDGTIVDMDGSSALSISGLTNGNYFVVVRTFTSLGIMSANAITFAGGATTKFDFSNPVNAVFGTQHISYNGFRMLATGDINHDGIIDSQTGTPTSDHDLLGACIANTCTGAYDPADLNEDNVVNASDASLLNSNVSLLLGAGPGVATEQLP